MNIYNIIRAGIFFTAALLLTLFPQQIVRLQFKAMGWFLKRFNIKVTKKRVLRSNRISAIVFFVIAAVLLVVGILQ